MRMSLSMMEINEIFVKFETITLIHCQKHFLNAENFYVLKIHLNLFEISKQVLKFENLI